jgi:hypothetical protein
MFPNRYVTHNFCACLLSHKKCLSAASCPQSIRLSVCISAAATGWKLNIVDFYENLLRRSYALKIGQKYWATYVKT